MRYQGKITSWQDEQGFGFITPNGGGKPVFAHIKSFSNRQRRPVGNDIVTYKIRTDKNGRPKAVNAAFAGERKPSAITAGQGKILPIFAIAFLTCLLWLVIDDQLPLGVLGLYLGASIITFAAYALDKSAARRGRWRTQESTLHIFALAGGWPGALAAQRLFRHKTRKPSFQIVFAATILLNCGALGWLLSPAGAEVLHALPGLS